MSVVNQSSHYYDSIRTVCVFHKTTKCNLLSFTLVCRIVKHSVKYFICSRLCYFIQTKYINNNNLYCLAVKMVVISFPQTILMRQMVQICSILLCMHAILEMQQNNTEFAETRQTKRLNLRNFQTKKMPSICLHIFRQ